MTVRPASKLALVLIATCLATGCVSLRSTVRYDTKDPVERVPVAVDVAVSMSLRHGPGGADFPVDLPNATELATNTRLALAEDLRQNGPYSVDVAHPAATLNVKLSVTVDRNLFPLFPFATIVPFPLFGVLGLPTDSATAKLLMEAELLDANKQVLARAVATSQKRYWSGWYYGSHDLSDPLQEAASSIRRQLAAANAVVVAKLGPTRALDRRAPLASSDARPRRLAVLEFRGALQPELLATLADQARAAALEAAGSDRVAVMTRESLAVMVNDLGRNVACSEGECEVELARSIGADLVVTGEVVKLDDILLASLKLHETAKGLLISTSQARGKTPIELVDATKAAANVLFR